MSRTQPTEDATFPVYRVQAKCPKCGKKGETKAFKKYPKDTVIDAKCSACVTSWEASVDKLCQPRPVGEMRAKRKKQDEPEHNPREHKPHWTDI